jgi:hypothetical protein
MLDWWRTSGFWRKDARDHLDAKGELVHGIPCISGRPMNNLEGGYEERLRKRMQLVLLGWCTPCGSKDNWGWLKFSVVPTQNFTLEYIIASGYFADFFSGCCVLEVFNKVMLASWTRNFLWSLKYLAFRKWRQVVHRWWTGAHHVCVSRENWG